MSNLVVICIVSQSILSIVPWAMGQSVTPSGWNVSISESGGLNFTDSPNRTTRTVQQSSLSTSSEKPSQTSQPNPTTNADDKTTSIRDMDLNLSFKIVNDTYHSLQKQYQENKKNAEDKVRQLKEDIQNLTNKFNEIDKCRSSGIDTMKKLERKLNSKIYKVGIFAQRNSTYKRKGFIPFDHLHAGRAKFNLTTGDFTASIAGIYHLYFSALKMKAEIATTSVLTVQFVKISKSKEYIVAEGHVDSQDKFGWFPLYVQATVALELEDRVHVQLLKGSLHESGSKEHLVTGFGGFLVGLLPD